MKGSRENHSSRPAGSKAGHTTPPENGGGHAPLIRVQCPNPACGKTYTIRSSAAGKNGQCTCGVIFPIPSVGQQSGNAASPAPKEPHEGEDALPSEEAVRHEDVGITEVRVGCIGRGHAGKTALLRALEEGSVGDFFASGLHVDAGDPREVARMIREAEETQRLLHQLGLPPTLKASQLRYYLYDGAAQQVVYKMREVIGQILTHTLPNSGAELQAPYTEYLRSLVNTHVLWAVIPCPPPDPNTRDRRRYANDLRITLAYLREALRPRSLEQPVAVALVLSKIDTLFEDPEDARASLNDDVLRKCFGPLVHLVEQSSQVSDAVIIPLTAFGFGNAVLRGEGGEREGAHPEAEGEPFGSEPIWLLREGVSAQPYNLDSLFIWTLLFGLLNRAGHGVLEEDTEIGQICRTLREDLDAIDPWLLPLTGGIAGEGMHTAAMQSAR